MKVKIKTNLWSGIVMGAASIVLLFLLPTQVREPAFDSGAPSPRIIPMITLVGILICSVILIIQSVFFKKEKIYEFDLQKELPMILLILLMVVFTALIIHVGFIPAVCITFPALLFYAGERKPPVYIFALAVGIGIYYLFRFVFNISLPSFPGFGG